MKLNCAEVHSTSSSEHRERCIINMLEKDASSIAKSRSLTESKEFLVGALKPSCSAVKFLSIGYEVPAKAAEPKGDRLTLLRQSRSRS